LPKTKINWILSSPPERNTGKSTCRIKGPHPENPYPKGKIQDDLIRMGIKSCFGGGGMAEKVTPMGSRKRLSASDYALSMNCGINGKRRSQ
jgi:hypothetical protein